MLLATFTSWSDQVLRIIIVSQHFLEHFHIFGIRRTNIFVPIRSIVYISYLRWCLRRIDEKMVDVPDLWSSWRRDRISPFKSAALAVRALNCSFCSTIARIVSSNGWRLFSSKTWAPTRRWKSALRMSFSKRSLSPHSLSSARCRWCVSRYLAFIVLISLSRSSSCFENDFCVGTVIVESCSILGNVKMLRRIYNSKISKFLARLSSNLSCNLAQA